MRGHGAGQEILQTGKREVLLTALEPVGNYAVQPRFSDGHDSGIYSWDYLLAGQQSKAPVGRIRPKAGSGGPYPRERRDAPMSKPQGGGHGCA